MKKILSVLFLLIAVCVNSQEVKKIDGIDKSIITKVGGIPVDEITKIGGIDISAIADSCHGVKWIVYGGQTYSTIAIGTQCWMAENLNIGDTIMNNNDGSNNGIIEKYCYANEPDSCDKYGGLYQWREAMNYDFSDGTQGICPPGWHLPKDEEYVTLLNFLGGGNVAAGKMKTEGTRQAGTGLWFEPNTDGSNESGFSALPASHRSYSGGIFGLVSKYAYLWSSTNYDTSKGWGYRLAYENNLPVRGNFNNLSGFSVRCIKN